jgi:hypothetical protein
MLEQRGLVHSWLFLVIIYPKTSVVFLNKTFIDSDPYVIFRIQKFTAS